MYWQVGRSESPCSYLDLSKILQECLHIIRLTQTAKNITTVHSPSRAQHCHAIVTRRMTCPSKIIMRMLAIAHGALLFCQEIMYAKALTEKCKRITFPCLDVSAACLRALPCSKDKVTVRQRKSSQEKCILSLPQKCLNSLSRLSRV